MKNELKTTDFDFEYTGGNFKEKDVIQNGFIQLTGKELLSRISNVTVFGDYLMGYKYVTDLYENGNAEGMNNVGSHNLGSWASNSPCTDGEFIYAYFGSRGLFCLDFEGNIKKSLFL